MSAELMRHIAVSHLRVRKNSVLQGFCRAGVGSKTSVSLREAESPSSGVTAYMYQHELAIPSLYTSTLHTFYIVQNTNILSLVICL